MMLTLILIQKIVEKDEERCGGEEMLSRDIDLIKY